MKAVVIGNCQARPMAALLQRLAGVEVLGTFLIHLAKEEDRALHDAALAEADAIFAQLTFGTGWPERVRSDYLKQRYPEKTVIWPNIYFRGQQPYLHYAHYRNGAKLAPLAGPLTEYHHLWLLRDWFRDRHGIAFADHITEAGYEAAVIAGSIRDLARRETACDVIISDVIASTYAERRLFFTFNHPSMWLLARLCERMLAHVGSPARLDESDMKEALGRIRPPASLSQAIAVADTYQGVTVNLQTPGKIALGPVRAYTPDELKQTAFACYDHQQVMLRPEALKLSP